MDFNSDIVSRPSLADDLDYELFQKTSEAENCSISIDPLKSEEEINEANFITYKNAAVKNKILASLLPDEILYHIDDYNARTFDGVILFGDVSGFTDLCEKYSKGDKGGSSRLTQVLNSYIGAMVQEIMSHSGDILKFSGDAFVVVWRKTDSVPMRDAVHIAIDCGLIIQRSYGTYVTDVDVTIRVKLIISAGPLTFSVIGDETNSHYLEIGQPIWDIKAADGKSGPGDVVISPSAWQYVSTNEYLYAKCDDGLHVKVLGIGPNWRVVTKTFQKAEGTEVSEEDNEFSLRPAVNYAVAANLKEKMRKFILKPVMNALDLHEPLDYLTEVRQVAIIMLDLILESNLNLDAFLHVANETYKLVCKIVSNYNGIVNKINFFDKDLMVLIIFGLRGFKMDSESEIALKCATECRKKIIHIPGIQRISVGVTTGKTYCGVFGHSLRKEYTVISLMVNKAARLMMMYPDKVTCDRNVFISSKLDHTNFILLEYKLLKGISNPGPVYEFIDIPLTHKPKQAVNKYPILGRNEEVEIYQRLTEEARKYFSSSKTSKRRILHKDNHYNILIIESKRLLGKNRLMEEFAYLTSNNIPNARCNLIISDKEIPYQTIRLMFLHPLGLKENSSLEEINKKLHARLYNFPCPDKLCCLNEIFDVDFPEDEDYITMSDQDKTVFLNKVFKFLAIQAFVTFWVVSISNIQYVDKDSWIMIKYLLKLKLFFVVGSRNLDEPFFDDFNEPTTQVITLGPIDKAYHGALACQLMHVDAITPDLEKIVQARSEGKPGWTQNFLISLIQSSDIIIKNMTYKEAYNRGLSMPPEQFLKRLTEGEKNDLKKISEEETEIHVEYLEWSVYKDCYRDSFKDLTDIEAFEQKFRNESIITVAMVNPNFTGDTLNIEVQMDVLMIKTFDSLNSYQQLVIKCSSVLTDHFPRDMLLFIMNSGTQRQTAIAVKTLFEKLVLSCAHGDFLDGTDSMLFKGRLLDPTSVNEIKCDCRGVLIQDSCIDLPKYASCGYLRFRVNTFRHIIYNLLTNMQKKEFHNRAIKFLEKETRRCRSCGGGYFVGLLGQYRKNEWKSKRRSKWKKTSDMRKDSYEIDTVETRSIDKESASRCSTSMGGDSFKRSIRHNTQWSIGSTVVEKLSHESFMNNAAFGFKTIKNLRKKEKLMKTFSNIDFSECQCHLILIGVYAELVDHCRGAENLDKLMDSILMYAQLSIDNANVPEAKRILSDANDLINDPTYSSKYLKWMLDIKRGKINTLMGYALKSIGLYNEAYELFIDGLKYYGYTLPTSKFAVNVAAYCETLKHRIKIFVCSGSLKTKESVYASFYDDVSECLCHISKLFIFQGKWKKGMLTAALCLMNALNSSMNYVRLCNAYANMILLNCKMGKRHFSLGLETYALRMLHIKKLVSLPDEVRATANLYTAIFKARLYRSELILAMEIGYVTWRIGNSKKSSKLLLDFLPLLMLNAILRKMINEAVLILQELEYYANDERDITGKVTFYTLCIIMQLETCYTIESFRRVEEFLKTDGFIIKIKDVSAQYRLSVVIWLWCVRNENWELAKIWEAEAYKLRINHDFEHILNIVCGLYLLEGQIILLVSKIDKKNVEIIIHLRKRIEDLFQALANIKKIAPIIRARLIHLKAYYKLVKSNDYSCLSDLARGKQVAIKYENLLEVDWIQHTERAWVNELTQVEIDFWKEHTEDNLLDVHDGVHIEDQLGFYTLPVPIYF